jgi:hypothetical protein
MSNFIQDNSFDCGHGRQVIKVSVVEEELNSLEKENAELKEAYKKLELMYAEYLQSEHNGTIEEALEFIRKEQGE